jgi:hypothetical protein
MLKNFVILKTIDIMSLAARAGKNKIKKAPDLSQAECQVN